MCICIIHQDLTPACLEYGDHKLKLYDYVQSIFSTFFNICSMYALDVIVIYLSLLYLKNIRIFIDKIETRTINKINDCEDQFDQLTLIMNNMRSKLGFIVSLSFIMHLSSTVYLALLYLLDQRVFWEISWCGNNMVSFALQFTHHAMRLGAVVYGPMLINTKSHTIPQIIIKHLHSNDNSDVIRFYLNVKENPLTFRICFIHIYWGRFAAFAVGCVTTLIAAFVRSEMNKELDFLVLKKR